MINIRLLNHLKYNASEHYKYHHRQLCKSNKNTRIHKDTFEKLFYEFYKKNIINESVKWLLYEYDILYSTYSSIYICIDLFIKKHNIIFPKELLKLVFQCINPLYKYNNNVCIDSKILDPSTNRYVNKNGIIGRKITRVNNYYYDLINNNNIGYPEDDMFWIKAIKNYKYLDDENKKKNYLNSIRNIPNISKNIITDINNIFENEINNNNI